MKSKNGIVMPVLATLMLSACTSSDYASDEYCQDPSHNHVVPVKHHESLVYAGPTSKVGYENIYERYSKLDTLYFTPSFRLVEGALLVNTDPHSNEVYPSGNHFEEWIMVQTGKHHQVCTDEYPACLSDAELEKYLQATGSHAKDYDRKSYLESIGSDDNIYFDFDSSKLNEKAVFEAKQIAEYLVRYPSKKILILGSADSIGSAKYNKRLSRSRAEALKSELVRLGIPESQIVLSWQGEYQNGIGPEFRVAEIDYE